MMVETLKKIADLARQMIEGAQNELEKLKTTAEEKMQQRKLLPSIAELLLFLLPDALPLVLLAPILLLPLVSALRTTAIAESAERW